MSLSKYAKSHRCACGRCRDNAIEIVVSIDAQTVETRDDVAGLKAGMGS
jgi:hypothetical protein